MNDHDRLLPGGEVASLPRLWNPQGPMRPSQTELALAALLSTPSGAIIGSAPAEPHSGSRSSAIPSGAIIGSAPRIHIPAIEVPAIHRGRLRQTTQARPLGKGTPWALRLGLGGTVPAECGSRGRHASGAGSQRSMGACGSVLAGKGARVGRRQLLARWQVRVAGRSEMVRAGLPPGRAWPSPVQHHFSRSR